MHVWYVDAGIEDTPEPVYTHCLVLSCLQLAQCHHGVKKLFLHCGATAETAEPGTRVRGAFSATAERLVGTGFE